MRRVPGFLVALSMVAHPSPSLAGGEKAPPAAAAAAITLSFKLDPRLSGSTYGGEKWVSPQTYTGATGQIAVEAKAQAIDARGMPLKAGLEWTVSDPEVAAVSAPRGAQVTITARHPGEARVTVASGKASRRLTVRAVESGGLLRIAISQ